MKLLFKQRFFSWLDSYDIFYEDGTVAYTVQGKIGWGHRLHVLNNKGEHIATVKEKVWTWMPKFELYLGENLLGSVKKKFAWRPSYEMDFNGWTVTGNFMEWNYTVVNGQKLIASISKEIWKWTDTYVLDVVNPEDALLVLLFTLAVDAEKCSRNN